MDKKDFINQIRNDYSPKKNTKRTLEGYANSIKKLAEDLYSKETHFIFELIQNAEDNSYEKGVDPILRFNLTRIQIEGEEVPALIVENNETGFQEKHVNAICKVGESTKDKTKGYIGEKGIGFKSVFKITDCPYIFSNGFYFALPKEDQETKLGYIVPRWVENPPDQIDNSLTTIILPLKKDIDITSLLKYLHDIEPEVILFLDRIKKFEIKVDINGDDYEVIVDKNDKKAPLIEFLHSTHKCNRSW